MDLNLKLPNVRKLFIPDPGKIICDIDLAGADAQVVAWRAADADLKHAFRTGLKLHLKNARDIFPDKTKGWSDEAIKSTDRPGGIYYACKRGVHGTNYGASARTTAAACGWTIREAESFQARWFGLHPGIKQWHVDTERRLKLDHKVTNAFGFSRTYFDRTDGLLPEALAWEPQSTVAIVCFLAAQNVDDHLGWVEFLIQVHDSLVFQIPIEREPDLGELLPHIRITVPFPDDPLVIPWGLSTSRVSWGDCAGAKWPE